MQKVRFWGNKVSKWRNYVCPSAEGMAVDRLLTARKRTVHKAPQIVTTEGTEVDQARPQLGFQSL